VTKADVPPARFTPVAAGRLANSTFNRGFIAGTDASDSTLDEERSEVRRGRSLEA
jgi:hypothetical protein